MRIKRRATVMGLVLAGIGASGCHGPVYEASLARREKSIHDQYAKFMAREEGRPLNIKKLNALSKELQDIYAERLDHTLKTIEERAERDVTDWELEKPARREMAADLVEGDESNIKRFWEKMIY